MKIFEKIQFTDGGPNDKGTLIGYVYTEDMNYKPVSENGFIEYKEIPLREYYKRKNEALKSFDLIKL